jgi:hypothetical protein
VQADADPRRQGPSATPSGDGSSGVRLNEGVGRPCLEIVLILPRSRSRHRSKSTTSPNLDSETPRTPLPKQRCCPTPPSLEATTAAGNGSEKDCPREQAGAERGEPAHAGNGRPEAGRPACRFVRPRRCRYHRRQTVLPHANGARRQRRLGKPLGERCWQEKRARRTGPLSGAGSNGLELLTFH